jgi:Holliday junction DNA helicase RuvA
MIGFLSGEIGVIQDKILVKTGGVGYEVAVGTNTLAILAQVPTGELFIHTHVKEEALELYGFRTLEERSLFRLLLSVSGVGPKTALAIANTGADSLRSAVQTADVGFFTTVPRVGKKLAQKIIIELKSKLGSLTELQLDTPVGVDQDAAAALTALGFDEQTVLRQLHSLTNRTDDDTAETLIKKVLKQLNTKKV